MNDLGMREISAKMVPRILQMTRNDVGLTLHLIFYTMQRCLIGSLPVMKRVFITTQKQNSTACNGKPRIHLGRKKHACLTRMLVCFFTQKGIAHYEFTAKGQTGNQQCSLEVLTRLRECVWRKKPKLWSDKWILHHDNALAHDTLKSSQVPG
jgi:hypothetical protein